MRGHDETFDAVGNLRPHGARIDSDEGSHAMKAAAMGRTDVLDQAGVLALQRSVGNSAAAGAVDQEESPVLGVVRSGGGSPLEPEVQQDMEARLGHDFSDVRVHTGGAASDSAKSVNAQAYTVGSDVVFQDGKYDPSSSDGKVMLAHELTHVVQQRQGPVDGTPTGGGVNVSHPSDRFERDASAAAESAMSAPAPVTSAAGAASGASIQRQEEEKPEEEETAQGSFVQRQDEPEEAEEQS
jgi:Domain of unknown function (DUF4157)